MVSTVQYAVNPNGSVDAGPTTLVGQTFTLNAPIQAGELLTFNTVARPDNGSFIENANFYTYNPATNTLGSLIGQSPNLFVNSLDGYLDYSITASQSFATNDIAVVLTRSLPSPAGLVFADSSSNPYAGGTEFVISSGDASLVTRSNFDLAGTLTTTPGSVSTVGEPSGVVLMGAALVIGAGYVAARNAFKPKASLAKLAA